ncbi:MAG: branched-chain amino acid ABC transporter substrate-binding protein [Actinomycetota bacterium]|nr:branched-chain amino acid ABC transporter substrate-binding protein [Actinomycetota bacterium]
MNRSYRKPARGFALMLTAALILGACGGDDDTDETTGAGGGAQSARTYTIGFVGALTGDNANLGINIRDGIKVAIEEENRGEGPDIALKEFDTAGDPAQATTVKDRFINDRDVIGIVGPAFSGETKALIPSIQEAGLPMISPSATNKDLPTVVPNASVFHRVIADDALQAGGVVAYLAKESPRSLVVVHDNTEYGKGLADDVVKQATEKRISVARTLTVDPKAQDFSATVNDIRAANPSHIFYGGYYAEAGRLKKQLTDAGVRATFVSGDGSLDAGFAAAAGAAAAEGARLTCPCNLALESSTGQLKTFYENFKRTIGKEPGLYSPEAYDAAKILIQGIKAGNTDRAKLLGFLEGFGRHEGISKTIEFEPNGNLKSKTFFVFEVKGGKIAPLQQIEVA